MLIFWAIYRDNSMFCQIHTVCLPTRSAVMCADFEIFLECFFSVLNAANCARNVYRVICIFSIRLKLFYLGSRPTISGKLHMARWRIVFPLVLPYQFFRCSMSPLKARHAGDGWSYSLEKPQFSMKESVSIRSTTNITRLSYQSKERDIVRKWKLIITCLNN